MFLRGEVERNDQIHTKMKRKLKSGLFASFEIDKKLIKSVKYLGDPTKEDEKEAKSFIKKFNKKK